MDRTQSPQCINVGLIGAGAIARFHAQALKKLPGVRLAAVCDRDHNRAVTLQQAFGVPHVFGSITDMARGVALDAVHILVPPAAHAATAISCLEHGWHALVEKPFATRPEECRDIESASIRAGRHVAVNHNLTFLPAFLRLIRDIRARRLGRVENVHVSFNVPMPQLATGQHNHWMFADTGNIILELGAHPLSVIVRLMGPVETATSVVSGRRTLNTGVTFFDTWQTILACERGTAQCYFSTGGDFADGWVSVTGQDGSAVVDLLRNTYVFSNKTKYAPPVQDFVDSLRRSRSYLADGIGNITNFAAGLLGFRPADDVFSVGMRNSVVSFYEALGRGAEPPAGIVEARAVIDACHSVIDSAYREERHHVQS